MLLSGKCSVAIDTIGNATSAFIGLKMSITRMATSGGIDFAIIDGEYCSFVIIKGGGDSRHVHMDQPITGNRTGLDLF